MNTDPTQPEETSDEVTPSNDVLTDDGVTITPTPSHTKTNWFDSSASWVVVAVVLIVMFIGGVTWAFQMGIGIQKNEITSTTYTPSGACHHVQYFMVSGMESGENPTLFAKYQAEHPNELPSESHINRGCLIPFSNN